MGCMPQMMDAPSHGLGLSITSHYHLDPAFERISHPLPKVLTTLIRWRLIRDCVSIFDTGFL